MLQWGRNFIVAETLCPPLWTRRTPCFNGAATLSLRKHLSPQLHTNMVHSLQWGRNFIVAETPIQSRRREDFCPLQWGRNFIVAETLLCSFLFLACSMLQWGRNFIVAETIPGGGHDGEDNAVLQWGRNFIVAETCKRRYTRHEKVHASMGPQLYRCGNAPCLRRKERPRRCFNGAATLSLRKPAR